MTSSDRTPGAAVPGATRGTVVVQLVALLAVQPLLLVSTGPLAGAGPLVGLLGLVLLDALVVARAGTDLVAHVAEVLMRLGAALTAAVGFFLAWAATTPVSWTATVLLGAAGAGAVALRRLPRLASRLPATPVLAGVVAVPVLACLPGSLLHGP
ncbi:hypothetical protein [Geodermatophilus sp. SYSU D00079]